MRDHDDENNDDENNDEDIEDDDDDDGTRTSKGRQGAGHFGVWGVQRRLRQEHARL